MRNHLLLSPGAGSNPLDFAALIVPCQQITFSFGFSRWVLPRLCCHQKAASVLLEEEEQSPQAKISGSSGHFPGGDVPLSQWMSRAATGSLSESIFSLFVPSCLLWVCLCLAFSLTNSVCFCHSPFPPWQNCLYSAVTTSHPQLELPILKRMSVYRPKKKKNPLLS